MGEYLEILGVVDSCLESENGEQSSNFSCILQDQDLASPTTHTHKSMIPPTPPL